MSGITFSILGAPDLLPLKTNQRTTTMSRRENERPKRFLGSVRNSFSKKQSSGGARHHPQSTNISPPTRRPNESSANPFHSPSSFDAPPPYSPASASTPPYSPASTQAPQVSTASESRSAPVADDAYAFLNDFDTIFLIDDSGSMAGGLWRQTADAIKAIAPICTEHDADGIDIHFLNHGNSYCNITSASAVQEVFEKVRPSGATPIGRRLNDLFRDYFKKFEPRPDTTKPINIICITDGEPGDNLEGVLIQAAKRLDKLDAPASQVGVQFFQVGSDPEATTYLKELDDNLADIARDRDMRDMIDTIPFIGENGTTLSGAGILKVVLGAVTRRLDRRSRELHR